MGGFLSHFLVPGTGSLPSVRSPWCRVWGRTELSWWMGGIPPGLLSWAGLLKLIVVLRCSGLSLSLSRGWCDLSSPDLCSFVTVHVTSGPWLVHTPLPSLVTHASHWSRARWQLSWQISAAPIGWPPLNHGQFWKLLRVKMPASVDNIFRALLLTDVYFIFFMSYGWVVQRRGGWESSVWILSQQRGEKQKRSPSIVLITKQVTRSIYEKCKQCRTQ